MRVLRNLRIDEVSCVIKSANQGAQVLIRKADDDTQDTLLFDDIMKRRRDDEIQPPNSTTDADKAPLSAKLDEIVAEMIVARPLLHPHRARRWLLHTPHGRELLAQHTTMKKEEPMPQVDIMKLHNIASVREIAKAINIGSNASGISEYEFTSILAGHARLNKRAGESDGAALERILTAPDNTELRKAYRIVKGMASLEPTSVGVGSTETSGDSGEAVRLLREMAERQGRSFEAVFQDPENSKLAARTYTMHHRPTGSSPSYSSELEK
jgi:hypothetical protein